MPFETCFRGIGLRNLLLVHTPRALVSEFSVVKAVNKVVVKCRVSMCIILYNMKWWGRKGCQSQISQNLKHLKTHFIKFSETPKVYCSFEYLTVNLFQWERHMRIRYCFWFPHDKYVLCINMWMLCAWHSVHFPFREMVFKSSVTDVSINLHRMRRFSMYISHLRFVITMSILWMMRWKLLRFVPQWPFSKPNRNRLK